MLLTSYEPEVILPPCDYGRETVNVLGHVRGDISPVFPYLNAIMAGAQYDPGAQILRFRWEGRLVTLQPGEIAMGSFEDADEAIEALARLQKLINDTWERREQIQPSYEQRKRLTPMEVYRLLPKTNCKACNQPTCFVFAAKLVAGEAQLEDCPPLATDTYARQREELREMMESAAR